MARKKHSEEREAQRLALMLAVAMSALAFFAVRRDHATRAQVWSGAAALVGVLALFAFPLWMRVFRLWMRFALALSWVSTRVILSVFYYAILTPVGAVMRLLGKAPLDLAWKDGKPTYWIDKEPVESTVARYEKGY